ncbi:MAG: GDSL-type esterase/lipase family protein [Pseudomonadota bacterium]
MKTRSSIPGLSAKAAWAVTTFALFGLVYLGATGEGMSWPNPMKVLAGEEEEVEIVEEDELDSTLDDLTAELEALDAELEAGLTPGSDGIATAEQAQDPMKGSARFEGAEPLGWEELEHLVDVLGALHTQDSAVADAGSVGGTTALLRELGSGVAADALEKIPPIQENCRMGSPQKCRMQGLDTFFQKLEMVSMGQTARISAFGDSLIMGDQIVGALRRGLQDQFGSGGPGFFLPAKTAPWYAISGAVVYGDDGWTIKRVTTPNISDGLYGYGAQAFLSERAGTLSRVECDSRCPWDDVSQYEIYYLSQAGGGSFKVEAGKEAPLEVATAGARTTSNWFSVKTAPGDLALKITTGKGAVRLFGVVAENGKKGIVLDSLGILGATAAALNRINTEHLSEQVGHRSPDLVLLVFGTNKSEEQGIDIASYKAGYKQLIASLRKGKPDLSILVISPPARGTKGKNGIVLRPNIEALVEAQAEVARETGCAYWSAFDAMGGKGGPQAWFTHEPKLLGDDLTHFTRKGAIYVGKMIQASLLRSFMEYKRR